MRRLADRRECRSARTNDPDRIQTPELGDEMDQDKLESLFVMQRELNEFIFEWQFGSGEGHGLDIGLIGPDGIHTCSVWRVGRIHEDLRGRRPPG